MPKLFYILLGATPKGRHTEQHDVFFGIAEEIRDLVPAIKSFWPEAGGDIHIDGYQEVNYVQGHQVSIMNKTEVKHGPQLFFFNLGGYKPGVFQEFHQQHLCVANDMATAVKQAKQTDFYKTMGFKGAVSHIDDKYGVDVDDVFRVEDVLPADMRSKYSIVLRPVAEVAPNPIHVGYFKLSKL